MSGPEKDNQQMDSFDAVEADPSESMDRFVISTTRQPSRDSGGDLDSLAASIAEIGISHLVTPDQTTDSDTGETQFGFSGDLLPELSSTNSVRTSAETERRISSIAHWLKKELSKASSVIDTPTELPLSSQRTFAKTPSSSDDIDKQTKPIDKPAKNSAETLKRPIIKATERLLSQDSDKIAGNSVIPTSFSFSSSANVATSSKQSTSSDHLFVFSSFTQKARQSSFSDKEISRNRSFSEGSSRSIGDNAQSQADQFPKYSSRDLFLLCQSNYMISKPHSGHSTKNLYSCRSMGASDKSHNDYSQNATHGVDSHAVHSLKTQQFPTSSKESFNPNDGHSLNALAIETNTGHSDSSYGSFNSNCGLRSDKTSDFSTESSDALSSNLKRSQKTLCSPMESGGSYESQYEHQARFQFSPLESPVDIKSKYGHFTKVSDDVVSLTEYSSRLHHSSRDSSGSNKSLFEHQSGFRYSPEGLRVDCTSQYRHFPNSSDTVVVSAGQSPKTLYFPEDSVGTSRSHYKQLRSPYSSGESRKEFKWNYGYSPKASDNVSNTGCSPRHSSDSSKSHYKDQSRSRHFSEEMRVDFTSHFGYFPKSSDTVALSARQSSKTLYFPENFVGSSRSHYEDQLRSHHSSGESREEFKLNDGHSSKSSANVASHTINSPRTPHSPGKSRGSYKSLYERTPRFHHSSGESQAEFKSNYGGHSPKATDDVSPRTHSPRTPHSPGHSGGRSQSHYDRPTRFRHSSGELSFDFKSNYEHSSKVSHNVDSHTECSPKTRHSRRNSSGSYKSHYEHQLRSRHSSDSTSKSHSEPRSRHSSGESRFEFKSNYGHSPKASDDNSYSGQSPRSCHSPGYRSRSSKSHYKHQPRSRHSSGESRVDLKSNYGHSPKASDNVASNTGCSPKTRHSSSDSGIRFKSHYEHRPRSRYSSDDGSKSHSEPRSRHSSGETRFGFKSNYGKSPKALEKVVSNTECSPNTRHSPRDSHGSYKSPYEHQPRSRYPSRKSRVNFKSNYEHSPKTSDNNGEYSVSESKTLNSATGSVKSAKSNKGRGYSSNIYKDALDSPTRNLPRTRLFQNTSSSSDNLHSKTTPEASKLCVQLHAGDLKPLGDFESTIENSNSTDVPPRSQTLDSTTINKPERSPCKKSDMRDNCVIKLLKSCNKFFDTNTPMPSDKKSSNQQTSCTSSSGSVSLIDHCTKIWDSYAESRSRDLPSHLERRVHSYKKQKESRLRNRSTSQTQVLPQASKENVLSSSSSDQSRKSANSSKKSQKSKHLIKSKQPHRPSACTSSSDPALLIDQAGDLKPLGDFESTIENSNSTDVPPRSQTLDSTTINKPERSPCKKSDMRDNCVIKLLKSCNKFFDTNTPMPSDKKSSNQQTSCTSSSGSVSLIDHCTKIWESYAESRSRDLPSHLERRVHSYKKQKESRLRNRSTSQTQVLPQASKENVLSSSSSDQSRKSANSSKKSQKSKHLIKSKQPHRPSACTSSSDPALLIDQAGDLKPLGDFESTIENSNSTDVPPRSQTLDSTTITKPERSPCKKSDMRDNCVVKLLKSCNKFFDTNTPMPSDKKSSNQQTSCTSSSGSVSLIDHCTKIWDSYAESWSRDLPSHLERRVHSYKKQKESRLRNLSTSQTQVLPQASKENVLSSSSDQSRKSANSSKKSQKSKLLIKSKQPHRPSACTSSSDPALLIDHSIKALDSSELQSKDLSSTLERAIHSYKKFRELRLKNRGVSQSETLPEASEVNYSCLSNQPPKPATDSSKQSQQSRCFQNSSKECVFTKSEWPGDSSSDINLSYAPRVSGSNVSLDSPKATDSRVYPKGNSRSQTQNFNVLQMSSCKPSEEPLRDNSNLPLESILEVSNEDSE